MCTTYIYPSWLDKTYGRFALNLYDQLNMLQLRNHNLVGFSHTPLSLLPVILILLRVGCLNQLHEGRGFQRPHLLFSASYTWHRQKGNEFGYETVFLAYVPNFKSIEASFAKLCYKTCFKKSLCFSFFRMKTIWKLIHYQNKTHHNFCSGVGIGLKFGLDVVKGQFHWLFIFLVIWFQL